MGSHDDLVTALGLAVQEPVRQFKLTWSDAFDIYETTVPAVPKTYWRSGRG